ncbi:hypothetical protein L1987_32073 [Smallanthus sonchifolius]|uniref:Uncharacterized protein n=1 Tax=Smallanthus sonchifolius TaxID=185202 RepID=A0ACB9I890_9ASTR|nr:hypothetical protein L1987_32073 [Smallanthus sonchifolius]
MTSSPHPLLAPISNLGEAMERRGAQTLRPHSTKTLDFHFALGVNFRIQVFASLLNHIHNLLYAFCLFDFNFASNTDINSRFF